MTNSSAAARKGALTSAVVHPMPPMTITAAARELGIDRRTVQRYCRREPGIMVGKKVNLESLRAVIAYCKAADGRGFPLRRGRPERWLFKPPRKEKPIIRRRLGQRLEIIGREISGMNDAEQVQLLRLWPGVFLNFFWQHNIEKVPELQRFAVIWQSLIKKAT